jgi:hypothetical protein
MNKQPNNYTGPEQPRIDEARADFWYGSSRYPVHESQLAELKAAVEPHFKAAQAAVEKLMSKWSGGFTLKTDMATLDFMGDGWNVGFGVGNPQRFVEVALREAATDDEPKCPGCGEAIGFCKSLPACYEAALGSPNEYK